MTTAILIYTILGLMFSIYYEYIPTKETFFWVKSWVLFAIGILGWMPILFVMFVVVLINESRGHFR